MTFPSLWLGAAVFVAFFAAMIVVQMRAMNGDDLFGQRRALESDVTVLLTYVMTPTWFFALTGSFPWTYAVGATGLYVLTGIALWFALRAAGLPRDKRIIQTSCLTTVFMKQPHALAGCALAPLMLVAMIAFPVVAFQTAGRADLSNPNGLFIVALWVFTIPQSVFFVIANITRLITLYSSETPQQNRVQNFLMALRHYVLTAWTVGYPFLAFHRDLVESNPRWTALAIIVFLAAYALLVVLPYGVGRTRFIDRSREVLQKMNDAASRIVVATDRDVSEAYQQHILQRVLDDLRQLINVVVEERPFFKYYLRRVSRNAAALSAKGAVTPNLLSGPGANEGPPAGDVRPNPVWDKIIDKYGSQMPEWDYRLYIITQIQEILEQPRDRGWLRGSALATHIAVSGWLNRHYARSVVLGSVGVALSAVFALVLQAYLGELRLVAEAAADTVLHQVELIDQQLGR